ncbi:uncharacterized protein BXIN_1661 [Babesia sp. Xinjiang]|uniref:uncharacterized protein n=1 Tax=Babesia sp. Xinjiang TaxID=462227 RepID=UPI000A248E7E|nr:uncharacterized protein BXIN_1758 [Babesia sp. Xinjiang]XP_028871371.1 uncharacterized protein BXIN_1661 [Babesia sp. Xinjiang]ORM40842.1 hypothetical protein BXIN_1758 [Babesia sp. Xinjiang]ORM40915.1 hypothetical protein BXIN_1661 [Babesia sp. Xinjiang]
MENPQTHLENDCEVQQSTQLPRTVTNEELPEEVTGDSALHLSDLKNGESIPGISVALKGGEKHLMSLASIETQPPPNYTQFGSMYARSDVSYDQDKKGNGYNAYYANYYPMDSSWSYKNPQIIDNPDALSAQMPLEAQASLFSSCASSSTTKLENEPIQLNGNQLLAELQNAEGGVPQQTARTESYQKVVARNPVILVDKVERSLIVQWYENSIRREQRISYKKYGNAKAQQRAETLISKLLNGSTFEQLYPEKGPPILTIFENVGNYGVSLTRDRVMREWRVDWTNSGGVKMRARWSCKKVGNDEAKKRAETFANSLIQGTFNPRLLHKATGTRLSRNDMKYNAVLNEEDFAKQDLAIGQQSARKSEQKDGPARKRRNTGGDPQRKKGTRNTGKAKRAPVDFFNQHKTGSNGFLHLSADASFPGFYPMFPGEHDGKVSMHSGSFENLPPHGDALIAQNWQNYGPTQKMDYPASTEWNFPDAQGDFNNYNHLFGMVPPENMANVDWMNMNCMENYGNPVLDGPMSVRELGDDAPGSAESQSANTGYMPYYHLFPPAPSACFQDSMCSQGQMSLNNTVNEGEVFSESCNSAEALSFSAPSFKETDAKLSARSARLQQGVPSLELEGTAAPPCDAPNPLGAKPEEQGNENPMMGSYDHENAMNNMAVSWPGFEGVPGCDFRMNSLSGSQDYHQASMPEMYVPESFPPNPVLDPKQLDGEVAKHYDSKQMTQDLQDFYNALNMDVQGGMHPQNPNVMGNMGHVFY